MLYVNLRLSLEDMNPSKAEAAKLLAEAAEQVRVGKLRGQLSDRPFNDRVWFSVQHATEDKPDPHNYLVKLKGRDCGAFVYVQDAYGYVQSEGAKHWTRCGEDTAERLAANGTEVRTIDGRREYALYSEDDYTIHDRTKSDHQVVGMTSHHNAILKSVNR